jgi:hypothetical protein
MEMSDYNPMWYWWEQLQERRQQSEGPTSPSARSPHAGTYSPHYLPMTPPSPSPVPGQTTPLAQTGNSAVGSASFDIRQLLRSTGRNTPTPRKASAIAASPPDSVEMQVDSPEMSSADALAIAEALNDPLPHVHFVIPLVFPDDFNFSCSVALLAPLLEASEPLAGVHPSCSPPLLPYVLYPLFLISCPLIPRSSVIQRGDP